MKKSRGVVAAGHQVTAHAAADILNAGGNAFDAALAALFASCVAEPVLASLGGGGFLLAGVGYAQPTLYDFFSQTPLRKQNARETDFFPIVADFGTAQQEFHIGMGSIATPGVIKGAFLIHRELCSMPMQAIVEPACEAARAGVHINDLQRYISELVSPILESTPEAKALHATGEAPDRLARSGEKVQQRAMADCFELLATEGEALFYQGEMGRLLVENCQQRGGYLRRRDLTSYQVEKRQPLALNYHDAKLFTNPAPSVGGTLIAFTLALLEQENLDREQPGCLRHLLKIAHAQQLTQKLRHEKRIDQNLSSETSREVLTEAYLKEYRKTLSNHTSCYRGTTQISVADANGNMVSMTLSNGEGSGYVLPGTGIMLNNMLGEEDINPYGFHQWPENRRISSMMAPTLMQSGSGQLIATGSGGSNRIRSAILQVLINLIDFGMDIDSAVEFPRLHLEQETLNLEHAIAMYDQKKLSQYFSEIKLWPDKNLFFGGAHTVLRSATGELSGKGDSRRGGACIKV
ncbi:MAG: gamma-glutamyltransferase [Chromatiaceae bacterium]|nr:gamma-glutamyltransferase [Chromatiaceae bacterium]MCP5442486.1 gamma-glutamyltransferase [Chromatiaceae bacterium]